MNTFTSLALGFLLFAQASGLNAQQTNKMFRVLPGNHNSPPLPWGTHTNLAPAGWSKVKQPPPFDAIATNTPPFTEWAVGFMLSQANLVLTSWNLESKGIITTNNATWYFYASSLGPNGSIATIDGRYLWSFSRGTMDGFQDKDYFARTLAYSDQMAAQFAKKTSSISKTEVRRIAQDALRGLGFTPAALGLRDRPNITQYTYEFGGKQLPLPLYEVNWEDRDDPDNNPGLKMQVSGILKRIVSYSNFSAHTPKFQLPTNYFEMLGVRAH